ncbi:MAG: SDR family NAD(P)-dependent oxidoreductase [Jatrophihabitans sp.]|uniref:SDR family NAD(P)-dependent oxidoreductase n=1 Tax=Jatrophihabitans sp. TaxID=1932789 RepID=UPI003F7DA43D
MHRSVLITGAAGGLGAATAERFVAGGWQVFAADLKAPADRPGLVGLELDVTSGASCAAAADRIASHTEGLGAVVNFAGVLEVGPLVEVDEAALQRVLDVNVLGTYRVNKAMFPLVRSGGGRVVTVSSETGWQHALMLNGPYAMSKHAIEAYSDALRRELMFVDIPVITLQPGPFRTAMTGSIAEKFAAARRPGSPFQRLVAKVGRAAAREERSAHDPALLADVVWQAVTSPRPRARYSVRPAPSRVLLHYLPTPLTDRLPKVALR